MEMLEFGMRNAEVGKRRIVQREWGKARREDR